MDVNMWLRAYFAAGGTLRRAKSTSKLVREIKAGTRNCTKPRCRENIVEILRDQLSEPAEP